MNYRHRCHKCALWWSHSAYNGNCAQCPECRTDEQEFDGSWEYDEDDLTIFVRKTRAEAGL
jgi:hypothetical protein